MFQCSLGSLSGQKEDQGGGEEARDHIKGKWNDAATVHVFGRILSSYWSPRDSPSCQTCDALKGTLYIDNVIRRVCGSSEPEQRNSEVEEADQRATLISRVLGVERN